MVEFENRNVTEIRILKEDFHKWLEEKIPDVSPGDAMISFETDPKDDKKYLIKIVKGE